MNPGDWRDEAKKAIAGDKEVIINGVCVMNQSSDFNDDDENMDQSNDDGEDEKLTIAEGNDEDNIKKSFIKKPERMDSDDVKVKTEEDEAGAWEY